MNSVGALQLVSGTFSYSHSAFWSLCSDSEGEWRHLNSLMLYSLYLEHCHIHTLGLYIVTLKVSGDM